MCEVDMGDAAATDLVSGLVLGHLAPRCLHVIAEHGVADALGDAPASAAELAGRTSLNADALNRSLKLLVAHGVFAESEGKFTHNAASRLLQSEHPQSLRAYARMIGMPAVWNGLTYLDHAMKSGRPVSDWASLMAHFEQHPEESRLFNAAMIAKSAGVVPAVVEAYEFSVFGTIADIGGGRGHLVNAILDQVPAASGILFELPQVIAELGQTGSPRLSLIGGDFFADPLPVADCYLLMEVIHDWADAEAAAILAAVRRAAPLHARLLIIETLVAEVPGLHFGQLIDLVMLSVTGGRERTASEYATLLSAAGFRFERVIPTRSAYPILEASVV
jgi:O-methyltransferase domain